MHPFKQPDCLLLALRVVLCVGSESGLQHLLLHFAQIEPLLEEPGLLTFIYGDSFSFHLSHQGPVARAKLGTFSACPRRMLR